MGGVDRLKASICAYAVQMIDDIHSEAIGDSPIEKLFYTALRSACYTGLSEYNQFYDISHEHSLPEPGPPHSIYVRPQVRFDWGRADFVVYAWDSGRASVHFGLPERTPGWRKLIVECDGHDFHERTKSQASRDRRRDRMAQLGGLAAFRFTGSDLWNDPMACAMDVIDWARIGLP